MLYRRYLVLLSLVLVISVLFVTITRKAERRPPDSPIPVKLIKPLSPRILLEFQWAEVDATKNDTFEEEATPTKPTKKKRNKYFASDIVQNQSVVIAEEMGAHHFPDPDRRLLSDYVPARGGRPMGYIMLSTWETYYPILGDLLNTLPGNFFFQEPLIRYGVSQLNATATPEALVELRNLMRCNYSGAVEYLKEASANWEPLLKNKRLWSQCRSRKELCFAPEFLRAFCRQFPIKTMNIVRLRLTAVAEWLAEDADIRIILFVRDPRAVMQARQNKKWCKQQPDCADTKRVCQFMTEDWLAYKALSAAHPGRIKLIRFEDLALDPFRETQKLLDFLRAPFTAKTKEFLLSRTEEKVVNNATVGRQLRTPPFLWKERISFEKVAEIQEECLNATTGWGYRMLNNATLQDLSYSPLAAELR